MPRLITDPLPEVWVTYDDGVEEKLFSYFPDEISFTVSDFIGLRRDQAFELYIKRDKEYLRT